MNFFDAGQHAVGVIAIGQQATGVIAIGQVATGVIAIGQMARGGFCIGQLAIGLIGWGQLGVGILHAAGMVGLGGRRGLGLVLPLVPSLGRRRVPPPTVSFQEVHAGAPGWLAVDLADDGTGLGLYQGGQRLPIKLHRLVQHGSRALVAEGPRSVWAFTRRHGAVLVCERIAHDPPRPYKKSSWWSIGAVQTLALLVLGGVWWAAAGNDLVEHLGRIAESASQQSAGPQEKAAPPSKRGR